MLIEKALHELSFLECLSIFNLFSNTWKKGKQVLKNGKPYVQLWKKRERKSKTAETNG